MSSIEGGLHFVEGLAQRSFCNSKITKALTNDTAKAEGFIKALESVDVYVKKSTDGRLIVVSHEGDKWIQTSFAKDKTVTYANNENPKDKLQQFIAGKGKTTSYDKENNVKVEFSEHPRQDDKGNRLITKKITGGEKDGEVVLYTVSPDGKTLLSKQYKTSEAATPSTEATTTTDDKSTPTATKTDDDKSTDKDSKKKDDKDKGGWKNWLIGGGIATAVLGGGYLLLHKPSKHEHPEGAGAEGPAAAELAGAQPQLPEQLPPQMPGQGMYQMPQGQGGMPGAPMNQLQLPGQMHP